MRGNGGVDQIAAQPSEARRTAILVGVDEPTKTEDVAGELICQGKTTSSTSATAAWGRLDVLVLTDATHCGVAREPSPSMYTRDRKKTSSSYRTEDETMHAVGLFTHGGPEVLQVVELPEVHAGPGQVRIQVHAATVNPTDVGVRNGTRAEQQKADPPPYVPGMEAAGIVDEVGSGVPDRLKVGDAVISCRKAAMARIARNCARCPIGRARPCRKDPC